MYRYHVKWCPKRVWFGWPLVQFDYLTIQSLPKYTSHLNKSYILIKVPIYLRPIYKISADSAKLL